MLPMQHPPQHAAVVDLIPRLVRLTWMPVLWASLLRARHLARIDEVLLDLGAGLVVMLLLWVRCCRCSQLQCCAFVMSGAGLWGNGACTAGLEVLAGVGCAGGGGAWGLQGG